MKHIRPLHDNAPTPKAHLVSEFLKSEKVTVLPHPPFLPDHPPPPHNPLRLFIVSKTQVSCIIIYLESRFGNILFVSPSAFSRRAVVSYWRKYVHKVLVNRLGGLSLPRKSVVRLTDRSDMILDVYRGRKTTMQQQQCNYLERDTTLYAGWGNEVPLHTAFDYHPLSVL